MTNQWLERWENGNIGWHEAAGNRNLKQHWRGRNTHVLVPLCGKSKDLLWLEAQGNRVTGVELSEIAVRAFFDENNLDFTVTAGVLTEFRATERRVTIFCGDYFALQAERFDAHFDRGALIAMPPDRRVAYAAHTSSLLADKAEQLVIALEYDQTVASGPPYSVVGSEVLSYWPKLRQIATDNDIDNCPPKFREAGLTEMMEVVWRSP